MQGTNDTEQGEFANFCTVCCVLPFVLAIVGAAISYYVFGIIFLIDDKYICYDMSPLWIFSITALLSPCLYPLSLIVAHELRQCIGCTDAFRYLLVSALVNGVIFLYGAIIIYSPSYVCDNMKNAGLYTWAQVALYLNLIAMCILCCTLAAVSFSKNAEAYIDNHLQRHGVDPPVEEAQEAILIPEPTPMQNPAGEKDPLIRPSSSKTQAPMPTAAPPAKRIAELD